MPFRSNFFGEKYAQPGTSLEDINEYLTDKYAGIANIASVTIDDDGGDNQFKFGGRISFDEIDGDDETYVEDLGFDGFESKEAVYEWLTSDLEVSESDIEEDAG